MGVPAQPEGRGYDRLYEEFDSPLGQQLRRAAYGEDIGQHSWVTAEELQEDMSRLKLSRTSRFLDLGCGPGGPLTFVVGHVGCQGSGIDVSAKAIAAGRARAVSLGLEELVTLSEADLNQPIKYTSGSFDVVMSLDVILHLRDRLSTFQEVARVLIPGGKFLFTDAGVVHGAISDEEIRLRAVHGHTQFVPPGFNENMLRVAGFRVIDCEDRTASLLKTATGRLSARLSYRHELERLEGSSYFERQQRYLETVIDLSQRGVVSRLMYLAESLALCPG
jgi:SAM-dependent methyltransferase